MGSSREQKYWRGFRNLLNLGEAFRRSSLCVRVVVRVGVRLDEARLGRGGKAGVEKKNQLRLVVIVGRVLLFIGRATLCRCGCCPLTRPCAVVGGKRWKMYVRVGVSRATLWLRFRSGDKLLPKELKEKNWSQKLGYDARGRTGQSSSDAR